MEGGSSQTVNEALSSGLPIITNKFPNLSDYTKTNSVIKHLPGDYKKMAKSCLNILNNRQEFLKKSLEGRKYIEKYEFQNIRRRLIDIYRNKLGLNLENKR